jgi:adenylosuccinate synthase
MSTTRYASVLGLGFGDCGKGHFIDALARRWQARTVVRFNGGAQAGHNVVTPAHAGSPSRHHTFSQFGAATFVPGARTLLVDPMVIHPTALLVEAEVLGKIGINDALSRLSIDGQCRITTPFHQAAGRLRELLRGAAAHGTCGVGVGETVRHGLNYPDQELRYAEMPPHNTTKPRTLLDRLQMIRKTLLAEFQPQCPNRIPGAFNSEFQILEDETIAAKWLAGVRALARQCPPESFETIRSQLTQTGCTLFEGAQGVLLDEWRGFHPHTTWSSINTGAVDALARRFGIEEPIEHFGVIRTYLTRHGAGPLPTHDKMLDRLPEPHNSGDGWQGGFRRGHPDTVLLRYAVEAAGRLSGLLISHLDVFQPEVALKWCEGYSVEHSLSRWPGYVEKIPLAASEDLTHQSLLTQLLQNVSPRYHPEPIRSATEFLERVGGITSLKVAFRSYGPTYADVLEK